MIAEKPDTLPAELVRPLAEGNCVVFAGQTVIDAASRAGFVAALERECEYPHGDHALPAVAYYYEGVFDLQQLILRLRTWVETVDAAPAPLLDALARLPTTHYVDLTYDTRLARALAAAGKPHTPVIHDQDLPHGGLIKPFGQADQPASLVLTTRQFNIFFWPVQPTRPLLLDQLRLWAATQVVLWIGIDPADETWRSLHDVLTAGISPRDRREFALAAAPAAAEALVREGIAPLLAPDPMAWLVTLQHALAALPPQPEDAPPPPGLTLDRRPYKFLDYYTAHDADLFFGRATWIEQVASRIRTQPLTVLFGRSGVGKTSLLLAGVLPRLEAQGCWTVYARPGTDPRAALRAAVQARCDVATWAELANNTDLGTLLRAAGQRLGQTPVVVLDQAEECFTALARPLQDRWVAELAQALAAGDEVRWVLSLREDFAAELHDWSSRVPGLFSHTIRLLPLAVDEARAAITQPPQQVGVAIEPALVDRLLDDLTVEGVAPAQLQIVCERLYQARDPVQGMTLAIHEALGGTRQILTDYVDFALARFPLPQRELAVALLKAMVTGRDTKLPLRPAEILDGAPGDPAEKQAALAGLVDARLVRSLGVGETQARRYELAHEVLVEKVRSWIDETERAAHQVQDLLRAEREAARQLDLQVLPEREKVAFIHSQRENPYLRLDAADLQLMVRAAVHEGLAPGYWAQRAAGAGLDVWPLLAPLLASGQETERIQALWALAGWETVQGLEALRTGMGDPSPRVRVAAHQALYSLGSAAALAVLDTSDDLRRVPEGEFTMGSNAYRDEQPVRQLVLDAFFVEKYPVTNARFAEFIAAGGYRDSHFWTQEGWRWVQRSRRREPAFWRDEKWNEAAYPVVGVTWYEAWAYAHWAGRRLLTEAEWEKAARGVDGRTYPWGEGFDSSRCNTSESKLQRTTPAGHYSPQGDSPYGAVDMAGNMWEWTSSIYQPYPYRANDGREDPAARGYRVLRGGSWRYSAESARCAYRLRSFTPGFAYYVRAGCRCGVAVVSR